MLTDAPVYQQHIFMWINPRIISLDSYSYYTVIMHLHANNTYLYESFQHEKHACGV